MTSLSITLDDITGFQKRGDQGLALRGVQAGQEIQISVAAHAVPNLVQHAIGGLAVPSREVGAETEAGAFNVSGIMVGQTDTGRHTITMYLNPEAAITFLLSSEQMEMIKSSGALLGNTGSTPKLG